MKKLDKTCKFFNLILGVIYIPLSLASWLLQMASESTIDANNSLYINLINVFCVVSFIIPILCVAGIITSIVLRKRGYSVISFIVQFIPLIIFILNLILLAIAQSAYVRGEKDDLVSSSAASFTQGDYVIEFDEALLGNEYKTAGNEIKGCDYRLSFSGGKFNADMNFGNSVSGVYSVSGDGIVLCSLKTASGEYSPVQNISGEISFKIVSESEIKILSAPESYVIKLCELNGGEWVPTDEDKELSFWPLIDGISFKLAK